MHKLVRTRCSLVCKGSVASPARTLCLSLVTLKIAASIAKINTAVLEIDFYLLRVVRLLMYCDAMFAVLPVGCDDASSGDMILKNGPALCSREPAKTSLSQHTFGPVDRCAATQPCLKSDGENNK